MIFGLFRKNRSAPLARQRLQVLLAHERASSDSDLVVVLREEILAVISRHVELDIDKVSVKLDREENLSILEIEVEIPIDAKRLAA